MWNRHYPKVNNLITKLIARNEAQLDLVKTFLVNRKWNRRFFNDTQTSVFQENQTLN